MYNNRRVRTLEVTIQRYLFKTKRRPRLDPLLLALLQEIDEFNDILGARCPVCGRRFKSRKYLALHFRRSGRCRVLFCGLLRYVVEAYWRVRKVTRRDNGRYYVRGYNYYFTDPAEALRAAKAVLRI